MWRPMLREDIPSVVFVSGGIWGANYYESKEIFLNKLKYFPAGCKMYGDSGYVFSHPWTLHSPPNLDEPLILTYHIHDIALLPSVRNKGLCTEVVEEILMNHPIVTLVAANNTESFWKRFGFVEQSLVSYGTYMKRCM